MHAMPYAQNPAPQQAPGRFAVLLDWALGTAWRLQWSALFIALALRCTGVNGLCATCGLVAAHGNLAAWDAAHGTVAAGRRSVGSLHDGLTLALTTGMDVCVCPGGARPLGFFAGELRMRFVAVGVLFDTNVGLPLHRAGANLAHSATVRADPMLRG